ncbi:MAG: 54S ribosomal protein L4 mitochondrial [Stictis urceolatum]|nr:54S ribosomal protein L4 mitochondrial [Stictis urceolata]
MAAVAASRLSRLNPEALPIFLAPCVLRSSSTVQQITRFSTTARRTVNLRDRNKQRGVSALRRTGPKKSLSVSGEPLPRPVLDPIRRSKISVKEDHGLWQFFTKDKKPQVLPEVEAQHGRSWTVEELRHKSFDDLHSLWWICAKEINRISTQEHERRRVNAGYGEYEADERLKTVRQTQRAIKHTLTERWYAWDNAKKVAAVAAEEGGDEYFDDVATIEEPVSKPSNGQYATDIVEQEASATGSSSERIHTSGEQR